MIDLKNCRNTEEIYFCLIELGKQLPPFNPLWKIEENRVLGCQSLMYVHAENKENKVYFYAFSEALISAGLAWLLIDFYSGKSPQEILTTPPTFLDALNIPSLLSPSRSNGLASLHLHMKKIALSFIAKSSNNLSSIS